MSSSDWDAIGTGLLGTAILAALILGISTPLALLLAPLRKSRYPLLRIPMGAYVWLGRALPPLTFLYVSFFGLPSLGIRLDARSSAVVAFLVFVTAYNIEIFRAAIESIPPSQVDAARALGVGHLQTLRSIVLPQALPVAMPAYISNATIVLKETSLASVIGVSELTRNATQIANSEPGKMLTALVVIGAIYMAIASAMMYCQNHLEKRGRQPRKHRLATPPPRTPSGIGAIR